MPNLPISGLPASSTLQGDELFADVQGGVTKYTTLDDVTSYVSSSIEVYNQTNPNNSYIVPLNLTCQNGVNIDLTGATNENTAMFKLSWTGAQGVMVLNLPDCTTTINTNRAIRFISNGSYSTNTRSRLTPTGGQTLDGSTAYYEINKAYEGIMIWSDGTEWFIIQKKA